MHIDDVFYSDKYSVNDRMIPWLQCVQHFRRIETVHKGDRWFDIKRYGIELTHRIGTNRVETLTLNDKRRAIQKNVRDDDIPTDVNPGVEPVK